jgi:DNA-binding NarL/FixJ family response regulator
LLNVLVAYEKPSWQKGIQLLLARQSFINACYAPLSGNGRKLPGSKYDVVFLEAGRDKARLRDHLTVIRRRFPRSRLVVVLEKIGIRNLSFGHHMGICALLDEQATSDQILASLEAAMRGDLYVAASVIRKSETQDVDIDDSGIGRLAPEELSEREAEVLSLVGKGYTNKAIAKELYISEKTVKNHLYSVFRKIGVSDRTKAALFAVKGLSSHRNGPYAPQEVFFEIDEHQ